jgi:hypothetical protein
VLNPRWAAGWFWAHPNPAGHKRPMRERRVKSRSFSGLLATGLDGPSPLGHFRPSGTFSPLTAHKPRSADVKQTSATFLIKNPFLFQKYGLNLEMI